MSKNKIILSGVIASLLFFNGCSSKDEPKPVEKSESGLMLDEAEKIVKERQKELIVDVTKSTRVIAILAKKIKNIEQKIAENESYKESVLNNNLELKKINKEILAFKDSLDNYNHDALKKDQLIKKLFNELTLFKNEMKKKRQIEDIKNMSFIDKTGNIIVKSYIANVRNMPLVIPSTKVGDFKRGKELKYTSKNENWYKLEDGNYIHSTVVCEECTKDDKQLNEIQSDVNTTIKNAVTTKPSELNQEVKQVHLTEEQIKQALLARKKAKSNNSEEDDINSSKTKSIF